MRQSAHERWGELVATAAATLADNPNPEPGQGAAMPRPRPAAAEVLRVLRRTFEHNFRPQEIATLEECAQLAVNALVTSGLIHDDRA